MPGHTAKPSPLRAERFDPYDIASLLLLAALLAAALVLFRDYAISNDEEVQHRYGELILSYYTRGFTDRAVFSYKNLYLYGGLFDLTAVLIGRVLPVDIFEIRHVLCAVIGVGGLAATWATARLIAGPRAALLATVALAICGVWFGAIFNHTKDIPFAAAMIGASYFLLRATRDLPRPRLRDLFAFGLLLGAALGQRAMGLLLIFYVLLAIAIRLPRAQTAAGAAKFMLQSTLMFVPAFAVGYLIMIAGWPWAALNLFNPLRAIFAFAHFHYPVKTLFSGDIYLMWDVPRWYVPMYLLIKLPLVLLFGAALGLLSSLLLWRSAVVRARELALIGFIAIFPVACQVIGHGPAFSGMRHFIFVVPPLAVLAGAGFDGALDFLAGRSRALGAAAAAGLALALAWPASQLVRLHPYESLFFNPLVGGLEGAAQRYDTDYWVNGMHEMVLELERLLDREGKSGRRYFVAVCGERLSFDHEAQPRGRLRWATDDDPADFFIAPTHMNCDRAIDGKVVATVSRMGVPIGVIKDRRGLLQPDAARVEADPPKQK